MYTIKVVGSPDAKKLTVELEINGARKAVSLHESCYRADLIPGVELTDIRLLNGKLFKYRTNMLEGDEAVQALLGE